MIVINVHFQYANENTQIQYYWNCRYVRHIMNFFVFNSLNLFLCWGELFFVQQILECLNIHEKVCLNIIFVLFCCKIILSISLSTEHFLLSMLIIQLFLNFCPRVGVGEQKNIVPPAPMPLNLTYIIVNLEIGYTIKNKRLEEFTDIKW